MKIRITGFWFCVALTVLSILHFSCSKDTDVGTSTLLVRLTDAPGNFEAVFIDIREVKFTGNGNSEFSLNVNPGIYNLLDFTNGLDTLIASGSIKAGTLQQIRLVLGDSNSVIVDGITYPLATPSAEQSGLKLQVHKNLIAGVAYMLLLDFDANKSVVLTGNNTYILKPVIRIIDEAISGSVTGTIDPASEICSVTAAGNGNTYSTFSNTDGNFLLQGIPEGIYTVVVNPNPPLDPVVFYNVTVTTGVLTNLGVISF